MHRIFLYIRSVCRDDCLDMAISKWNKSNKEPVLGPEQQMNRRTQASAVEEDMCASSEHLAPSCLLQPPRWSAAGTRPPPLDTKVEGAPSPRFPFSCSASSRRAPGVPSSFNSVRDYKSICSIASGVWTQSNVGFYME